jgi:hypothetical protein
MLTILDDTNDVKFSLNNFLDFDSIINHLKSRVFSCKNGTILDITFKFFAEPNMQLIYDCFYASKRK